MKHKAQVARSLAFVVLLVMAAGLIRCSESGTVGKKGGPTRILFVADANNSRVLIYNAPFATAESANVVLGQPDFISSGAPSPPTASSLKFPGFLAVDASGNAFVSDSVNNRVLQYKPAFANGMAASLALGQPDLMTGTINTTQNGLNRPSGMAFDSSGNLWVADAFNNRVLQYKPPFATGMNASLVIGQATFTTGASGITSSTLNDPAHLAFDSSGNLWVADRDNSRVLEFKPPFANGMVASVAIGQADLMSNNCAPTSATCMGLTVGVAFDKTGNLWVGDDGNCRVLQFTPPFTTNMAASLELGQAAGATQFSDSCLAATPTQLGLFDALGVAFDSKGNLFVADTGDNRTMVFSPPFTNGMNAALVLGQPDFMTCGTDPSCTPAAASATSQNSPEAATPAP